MTEPELSIQLTFTDANATVDDPNADLDSMRDSVALIIYAREKNCAAVDKMLELMTPQQRETLIGALIGLCVNFTYALDILKPGMSDYMLRNCAETLASQSAYANVS